MKFCYGSMLSRVIMSSEFIKMRENIMELFENSFKNFYYCGECQLPICIDLLNMTYISR